MSITNYAAGLILGAYFRNASPGVPANMYVGLSTTTIIENGTGATEPSGANGYARKIIATTGGNWAEVSAGITSNVNMVTFDEATSSWGSITHVFLADALTGGNILYYEALTSPRVVEANTTVLFPAGSIQILMNNT